MASVYTNLKKGSSGNEVSALQTALNKAGYALQTTGLYDDATEAAVRQYQTNNGLEADGVAGDITLGKLYKTNSSADGYTPSAQLTEAKKYAESVAAQKPAGYQSAYTPQMQAQFEAIMNRQPFSYDVGSDAAFKQMQDMYTQQGRMAMMDTMGKAAELTGGYGNSYAQGAGQAAYNQYLQQLYAMAPEYEQRAFSRYQQEGADMLDRYNMMAAREENEYGRYMDSVNQYYAELDRAQQAADEMYNREYGEFMDRQNYQMALDEAAFQREQYQGKLDSEQREYAYNTALMLLQGGKMPSADLLAMAGISAADAAELMDMYAPKSSGGSGGGGSAKKDTKTSAANKDLSATITTNNILSQRDYENEKEQAQPLYGEMKKMALNQETGKVNAPLINKQMQESDQAYAAYLENAIMTQLQNGKMTEEEAVKVVDKYYPKSLMYK